VPAAIDRSGNRLNVYVWLLAGFAIFFLLEQFLSWHHCHQVRCNHKPLTYLILLADGLHNFIGGLAVAGAFLIDIRLGIGTWRRRHTNCRRNWEISRYWCTADGSRCGR
jgi:zinc and cadmium transporter